MRKWRDLLLKVDSERQIFLRSFWWQTYLLSELLLEIGWEGVTEEIFFHIFLWCPTWDLNQGLTSNKPSHYLLEQGDFIFFICGYHALILQVQNIHCGMCGCDLLKPHVFGILLTYLIRHNNPINGFRPAATHTSRASASCAPIPLGNTNRWQGLLDLVFPTDLLRGSRRRNISRIFFLCLAWYATSYLQDHGDTSINWKDVLNPISYIYKN